MQSDPRQFLYDVATAAEAIREFCDGKSFEDYDANRMLRSACERQLEIIGEAMSRLRDQHADVFDRVDEGRAIIALRNRLIHGYDSVDSMIVWDVITRKLAALERRIRQVVDEL